MSDEEILKKKLSDWKWRLKSWKLYKIKDKFWNIVPFIPNKEQLDLIDNMHYKNIILKARQLWFSTLIQILFLDQALFYPNIACWVIAQWLKEAQSIFHNKIKFAYDNLPLRLREARAIVKNNSDTIEFNNGSSIYVSTSFRWGTLQYLHVSEYWKICAKNPEKAREINTWAMESVAVGCYVFIESTAEWKSWDYYEKCENAKTLQLEWKKLNSLEFKFFFYPWWWVDLYRLDDPNLVLTQDTIDYFSKLKTEEGIKISGDQMKWYQLKKDEKKDDMFREYPSTADEAFMVAIEWSYYQKRITKTIEDKRICHVPYEPALPVHTAWDLWGTWGWDDMVVWFYQIFWKEIRIIDYFDWVWYSIKEVHTECLSKKPYKYWIMNLPHDAQVQSMNDHKTRATALWELWYQVIVLGRTAINTRIDNTRDKFQFFWFDKSKCSDALEKVRLYRRKWSDSTWAFLDNPEHEWSHRADWLWYLAQTLEKLMKVKRLNTSRTPRKFVNKITWKVTVIK